MWSLGSNGISESRIHFEGEKLITEEVQDVEPVLDRAQQLRGLSQNSRAQTRMVASIPLVVYHNWKKEWRASHHSNWTWQTFLAMKINSRDYSKLRTSDMKV